MDASIPGALLRGHGGSPENGFQPALHTGVTLEGMILKPKWCSGIDLLQARAVDEVADAHGALSLAIRPRRSPGIAFLSGGQSAELASARLNAMNVRFKSRMPWALAFRLPAPFSNRLLEIWRGQRRTYRQPSSSESPGQCNRPRVGANTVPPWKEFGNCPQLTQPVA